MRRMMAEQTMSSTWCGARYAHPARHCRTGTRQSGKFTVLIAAGDTSARLRLVLAARVFEVPAWRILVRHVAPDALSSLVVIPSLDSGPNVLAFAALRFLGLGSLPGDADGRQLLSFARHWIPDLARSWYIVVYPGGALMLFVLGWNLIGDAFRDALDPRLRSARRG